MVSKKVMVEAPNGLHARPVTALVALVKESGLKVSLRTPAKTVNGASMIGILSLGLKCGTEVEVLVEGEGEQAVLDKIVAAIEAIRE